MISVVLPIYNEEKGLTSFIDDLYFQMKNIGQSFEIILVNDGSTDKSLQLIQSLCTNYAELKFIGLSQFWTPNCYFGRNRLCLRRSSNFDGLRRAGSSRSHPRFNS